MPGYDISAPSPKSGNGHIARTDLDTSKSQTTSTGASSPFDDDHSESPTRTLRKQPLASPVVDAETYFNSIRTLQPLSRTNSVYSLSRISLSNQLSQLTSLALPEPSSLSTSISSIPNAPTAHSTIANAGEQIRKWLQKAAEVLKGLDAEDDVEWAAAGGREGLGELDAAIGKFSGLIDVYVTAIEDLETREDISKVSDDEQMAVVDQMEQILKDWNHVRKSMKDVKRQVEMAMEWEELWNTVLGDIGLELEALSVHVFEMEEARHKSMTSDSLLESNIGLDMQELDTIVEESATSEVKTKTHRFSLPSGFQVSSPVSPGLGIPHDDTRLLALFARMQPLRASLDFLPMTLSGFRNKAKDVLPTACDELEDRRRSLEKKWKQLETEAEGLREELGEDRWVMVFRNAGRQAQKLCESVEKAISKLQESIDAGTQHSNPPLLAKKVEAYEAKKTHYGPAIKKVLAIIEKGVTDRLTVNGEILRLREDSKARWNAIEAEMKDMDLALDDLTMNKNQQLRDSISSIVSMDRSATGSAVDTPGSSPASSVAMGPSGGSKRDMSPGMNGSSRRSSIVRPSTTSRRYFSMPQASTNSTSLPRKASGPRPFTSDISSRDASPSPYAKSSATPTPGSRPSRPSLPLADNKPRWNSSPKVDHIEFDSKPRHIPFSNPASGRKSSLSGPSYRSPSILGQSGLPLSSPLGRCSPAPTSAPRSRLASGAQSSLSVRRASATPAMAKEIGDWVKVKEKTPPNSSDGPKKPNVRLDTSLGTPSTPSAAAGEDSPSVRPRPLRPSTAMGSAGANRRLSMLPVPKNTPSPLSDAAANGRSSSLGARAAAVAASITHRSTGKRPGSNGRESRGTWK